MSRWMPALISLVVSAVLFAAPASSDAQICNGTAGNDTITCTANADLLYGFQGNDTMDALASGDSLYGGDGYDFMYGRQGNDWFEGMQGRDLEEGGDGADIMYGACSDGTCNNSGNHTMLGGPGNDQIAVENGYGGDVADGGDGTADICWVDNALDTWYATCETVY